MEKTVEKPTRGFLFLQQLLDWTFVFLKTATSRLRYTNVNFDHVGTPYGGSITKTRPEFYFENDVQHHLSIWEVKRKLPIQLFDDIYFFCLAARRPHTSMLLLDIHYQSWET